MPKEDAKIEKTEPLNCLTYVQAMAREAFRS